MTLRLDKKLTNEKINSCLVLHENKVVYEFFRNNKQKQKLHKVNSVTKSVLSILIGIAIDQGKIKSIKQPIADFFEGLEESKKAITVEHLLTMTPGFDWPEFTSWGGRPMPMINSKDWVKFVLEREMIEEPGVSMHYNSGASHLLSAILQKSAGEPLTSFAEKYLFQPLQIKDYSWHSDSKGVAIGGFGLSLNPFDLLKIGKLMLSNGKWETKRIVSDGWIQNSTAPRYIGPYFGMYGYHWWILTDKDNAPVSPHTIFAMGYGGQYIIVVPETNLVTIFTSDNYGETHLPLDYFKQEILPSLS
ncbi:serine hydrolase domain-containing protein [Mesobacillus jeotgali]|uniref:serine hydrolase domain-containing protein n=1 Tax=Mesobacillus jeotgali TaxID=129985 RepID=UPI001CFE9048|nr:serine hydrolase [Mesobacillus jeotgali]